MLIPKSHLTVVNGQEFRVTRSDNRTTMQQVNVLLSTLQLQWNVRRELVTEATLFERKSEVFPSRIEVSVLSNALVFSPSYQHELSVQWPQDERAHNAYGRIVKFDVLSKRMILVVRCMLAELGIHTWNAQPCTELLLQFVSHNL